MVRAKGYAHIPCLMQKICSSMFQPTHVRMQCEAHLQPCLCSLTVLLNSPSKPFESCNASMQHALKRERSSREDAIMDNGTAAERILGHTHGAMCFCKVPWMWLRVGLEEIMHGLGQGREEVRHVLR